MFANLNGWHALIIVAVILLLFGAPKIPLLARSLGQSLRILKTEVRDTSPLPDASDAPAATGVAASAPAPASTPAQPGATSA